MQIHNLDKINGGAMHVDNLILSPQARPSFFFFPMEARPFGSKSMSGFILYYNFTFFSSVIFFIFF